MASGIRSGKISLVSVRDKTVTLLFPTASAKVRPDAKTYASCPGPIDPLEGDKAAMHGLALRPGRNQVHTLYVVHHGNRESVEVFELDSRTKTPSLTWIGCALAPDLIGLNSVVWLPEGGFVVTNFSSRASGSTGYRSTIDANARARMYAGENSGELWEWQPGTGWKIVPGSESAGANGVEISKDGKWLYIGAAGSQSVSPLT